MNIPAEWFEPEVRDGFFINGMMKRSWAAQLEILSKIDEICTRHGLEWFADCGSLLGTVRHGGFIPWDDDIDICMLRDDYIKFHEAAKNELPEGYEIIDYHRDGFNELLMNIACGNSIRMDAEYFAQFHGFPFVTGIDIFPLDYASPDPKEEDQRTELTNLIQGAAGLVAREGSDSKTARAYISKVEALCHCRLDRRKPLKPQLMDLTVSLYQKYDRNTASEVLLLPYWIDHHNHRYKLEWFKESIRLPFEMTTVRVPSMYEAVLRTEYGADYMTPVLGSSTHNYPAYTVQEKMLSDHLGANYPFRYLWNEADLNRPAVSPNSNDVLFLPCKSELWPLMKAAYEEEANDPSVNALVIPIPWFERNPDGSLGNMHYDAEGFSKELPLRSVQEYDFAHIRPKRIYIQNGFDDRDYSFSVHPFFYSSSLRNITEELIYIPGFSPDEKALKSGPGRISADHLVTVPGVVRSDYTFLPSEEMRSLYLEKLVEWTGEERRPVWEKKLVTRISGKETLTKSSTSRKRSVLYVTGLSSLLENKEAAIAKMKRVLATFKEQEANVSLYWLPLFSPDRPPLEGNALGEEYRSFLAEYKKDPVGLLDESGVISDEALLCDAYYGDPSPAANKFRQDGKPVMLQNIDI